ncbi:acetyl coenzyme a transporter [Aspergillus heteromorphus CBS 117.55]|uniref:Acetyl coenzyme a transporter n=1 Tax=Aspergillus heteromorphus CBS 117.55 TaxID=1448321 RepID=A0A317X2H7_9EURO|nr:acetyl coenzyme a transporter [Aspergillus heteromorphus CBS 117.55]PWY92844.1 acetyl coenzyme a transporter [Aspergillus heteromorphus CBS 117.55]
MHHPGSAPVPPSPPSPPSPAPLFSAPSSSLHVPADPYTAPDHPSSTADRPQEVELQSLACSTGTRETEHGHFLHYTDHHLPSDRPGDPACLSSTESDPDPDSDSSHLLHSLLPPDASSSRRGKSPMKRKGRTVSKRTSKPSLTIATGQNGYASEGMDSSIEMRKRDTSVESNSTRANRLMSRPSFSLDQDPPIAPPQTPAMTTTSFANLPASDRRNFMLLCVLYFLQGIPMGLATGSVPFLLKPYLSYGQIGVFSLASYPYSLKLLWSPIVDAMWSRRFGRRKSWITPVQVIAGLAMIYLGGRIEEMMKAAGANGGAGVWNFTYWWFMLVFFCATQDIAVDGWAITLMSPPNISYASTAQTVGLTAGHFLSYTVFLAFNSADFANRWFRAIPAEGGLLSLGTYLKFWGWAYIVVTSLLAVMKKEDRTHERDSIMDVYRSMWSVLKLKHVHTIILVHLIAKIGFQANDGVTSLKLLDKGFGQDNMALVVLIDFPFEIGLGYYAGKWSTEYTAMRLWCWAFAGRLVAAVLAQITVMIYPAADQIPMWYLLTVIGEHIFSTFMNTVMFVAVSAFHARIADPSIGGTYMTMLATVSNLGGTFPRYFILKLVDMFTEATCVPPTVPPALDTLKGDLVTEAFSCALEPDRALCLNGGGTCNVQHDGYYTTNIICVLIGAVTFVFFIKPAVLKLQALPLRAWRLTPATRH